jgi:hypothetical protein
MNRALLTSLMCIFLVLFILSPFAALASLMIFLLVSTLLLFIRNIFLAIIGNS